MRVRGMAINQRLACCCRMSHICRMHFIPIDETINHRGMGTVVDALWLVCRAGEQILECPDLSDANSGNQVQIHPPPPFFSQVGTCFEEKSEGEGGVGNTHLHTKTIGILNFSQWRSDIPKV